GANRAPVERIKHQHDFFLSGKVRKLHFLLVLILQGKIRRSVSDRQAHSGSFPSLELPPSILPNPGAARQTRASLGWPGALHFAAMILGLPLPPVLRLC